MRVRYSAALTDVMLLAQTLDAGELQTLRHFVSVRIATNVAPKGKATKEEGMVRTVLEIIVDECHKKGLDVRASFPRALECDAFKPFNDKIEHEGIGDFLIRLAPDSQLKRRKLIRIAVQLLIQELGFMSVAVSARTIMNQIHRVPAVLDKAFPGYAAAGHVDLMLSKERKQTNVWEE